METSIKSLESQTCVRDFCYVVPFCSRECSADLRNQLTKELERNRHLALQKEVEAKEMQTKIDSAVSWSDYLYQARRLIISR